MSYVNKTKLDTMLDIQKAFEYVPGTEEVTKSFRPQGDDGLRQGRACAIGVLLPFSIFDDLSNDRRGSVYGAASDAEMERIRAFIGKGSEFFDGLMYMHDNCEYVYQYKEKLEKAIAQEKWRAENMLLLAPKEEEVIVVEWPVAKEVVYVRTK